MLVYDIAVILVIMCIYIVIPGIPMSYIWFSNVSFSKRFAISSIFGSLQFYFIYFGLKNGVFELWASTIFLVIVSFMICPILLIKNVRGKIRFKFK